MFIRSGDGKYTSLPLTVANERCRSFTSITPLNQGVFRTLHPGVVSGFADGEGCFSIDVRQNNRLKTG